MVQCIQLSLPKINIKGLPGYYHKLVELSSGNRKLEEAGQISVIEDKKRLEEFVEAVMKEQTYEQLTLF